MQKWPKVVPAESGNRPEAGEVRFSAVREVLDSELRRPFDVALNLECESAIITEFERE